MCTLTYLPENGGFSLVSSRDELRARGPMMPPVQDPFLKALYPVDAPSGGTWVLTAVAGFSAVLLNGGHEGHRKRPPYRHSRGLIPLMLARAGDLDAFIHLLDPEGLEPFTLVVCGHEARTLTDVVWTGRALERVQRDSRKPHIWSSSTLYDARMRSARVRWFTETLEQCRDRPPMEQLLHFHQHGGAGQAPATETIRMARPGGPETVCITGIRYSTDEWTMRHDDLTTGTRRTIRMIG